MTLAEQITYVLDRLNISAGQDSAKLTLARANLLTEYRRLAVEEHLLVDVADLVFVVGDANVGLPADCAAIIALRASGQTLRPVTLERFGELDAASEASGGTGGASLPLWYFQAATDRIQVWPAPAGTSTTGARLVYAARPPDPETDSDSMAHLPVEYHQLPCEMAVVRMAPGEDALDLAADAREQAAELRGALRQHVMTRQGTGGHRVILQHYHR